MASPFKTPWHFDKFRKDEEGEYAKIIGIVDGDWATEIDHARSKDFNVQNYNEQRYEHSANKKSKNLLCFVRLIMISSLASSRN